MYVHVHAFMLHCNPLLFNYHIVGNPLSHCLHGMYMYVYSFMLQCCIHHFSCSLSLSLPAELQWMSWSPFKLGLLLISAMQHSPSPAASFTQALTYFDLHNPLLSFLRSDTP